MSDGTDEPRVWVVCSRCGRTTELGSSLRVKLRAAATAAWSESIVVCFHRIRPRLFCLECRGHIAALVDAAGNELYPPPAILHRQSTAEDEELAIDWRADEEEYRTPYEDEDLSDWDRDDEDYDDADEEEEQLISEELADFGDEIARTHEEGWFDADDDPD